MMYYVILGILAILIIIFRKRVASTLLMVVIGIFLLFICVGLSDMFLGTQLRHYIPMGWYDNTVEDPVGTVQEISKKTVSKASDINDDIKEVGEDLDKKVGINKGTDDNKMWSKDENYSEDGKKTEYKEDSSKKSTVAGKDVSEKEDNKSSYIIKIGDMDNFIKEQSDRLTKKDKELLKGVTPLLTKELSGDNIKIKQKDGKVAIKFLK